MPTPALPRSLSGAMFALGGWAAFSLQDAIVKTLVQRLPVPEVLFGRSVMIVAISAWDVIQRLSTSPISSSRRRQRSDDFRKFFERLDQ